MRWLGALLLTTIAATAGCGDAGEDLAAFCERASDTRRFEAVFDDLDPADVDEAMAAFSSAREIQQHIRDEAPSGVRGDLDVLIDFLDDLVAGLRHDDPETGRPPVYDDLRPRFDQIEAAGDRVAVYVEANCR